MEQRQWQTGSYPSANGVSAVSYTICPPQGLEAEQMPRAIVQISHGMCEYFTRYAPLIDYLGSRGILVCGNDHAGHGKTAGDVGNLGFLGPKGADGRPTGNRVLAADLWQLTERMQAGYPGVPYILLGHSMGSFAARDYLSAHGEALDGCILSGTSGGNPAAGLGMALARAGMALHGEKHRSRLLNRLAFFAYNRRYGDRRTGFDWLTRDRDEVDRYIADPYCNFVFTVSGFYDLFALLRRVSRPEWAGTVPKSLPVLLISGDMDPVGQYGAGPQKVAERLRAAGLERVECKLYPGGRHEMVNEINRGEVFEQIADWVLHIAGA